MKTEMYNVLIAEDEPRTREGLKMLIDWESLGFCVTATAKNGFEALTLLKQQVINVLLTDIRMPTLGGIELVEQARKLHPDVKILLVSAYREFEYAHRALELGVKHYLLKPIEEEKLCDALVMIRTELGGPEPILPATLADKIKQIITHDYSFDQLGVSYISKKLNYNASYIGRVFQMSECVSIRTYIKNYRVSEAKRLLTTTNMKILEIAYAVGFHDVSTFYESFRDITGVPPAEYRSLKESHK